MQLSQITFRGLPARMISGSRRRKAGLQKQTTTRSLKTFG
jgi:hypothetical protein